MLNETTTDLVFSATIEFLPGQRAAIVEMTGPDGEWSGGGRIEVRRGHGVRELLMAAGRRDAAQRAAIKGGVLGSFSVFPGPANDERVCASQVLFQVQRRPVNGLNVEIGQPLPRCLNKLPEHWTGTGASSARWIASGGSALVFGYCTPNACPKEML